MANAFLANCKYGTESGKTQPLEYLSAIGSPATQFWRAHGSEERVVGNLGQKAAVMTFFWNRRRVKGTFKPKLMDYIWCSYGDGIVRHSQAIFMPLSSLNQLHLNYDSIHNFGRLTQLPSSYLPM